MTPQRANGSSGILTKGGIVGLVVAFGGTLAMMFQSGNVDHVPFVMLLVLATATTLMKVRLPGVKPSVSLSFFFVFAGITELPLGPALYIAVISQVFAYLVDREDRQPAGGRIGLDLASLVVCIFSTSYIYRYLLNGMQFHWAFAAGIAAVTYHAVFGAASALRIGMGRPISPWRVWSQHFFWSGPVYMMAPLCLGLIKLLLPELCTAGCT